MLYVTISLCLIAIACMIKNKKLKYTLFILSILISILSTQVSDLDIKK